MDLRRMKETFTLSSDALKKIAQTIYSSNDFRNLTGKSESDKNVADSEKENFEPLQ